MAKIGLFAANSCSKATIATVKVNFSNMVNTPTDISRPYSIKSPEDGKIPEEREKLPATSLAEDLTGAIAESIIVKVAAKMLLTQNLENCIDGWASKVRKNSNESWELDEREKS